VENVNKFDIILIYNKHKNNAKHGFVGFCISDSKCIKNTQQYHLFDDINLHSYYIEISSVHIFFENIGFGNLCNAMFDSDKKKLTAFKNKYLKLNTTLTELDGNEIYKYFTTIDGYDINDTNGGTDDDSVNSTDDDSVNSTDNDSNNSTDNDSVNSTDNDSNNDSANSTDNDSVNSTDDDSNNSSNENNNKKRYDNENGFIPVLLCPCAKFKLNGDCVTEFKNHYLKCDKCDKTNQNNIEISDILNTRKIIYEEICDDDDIYEYLDYYLELRRYKDMGDNGKIIRINNEDDDYHNSFLFLF